MKLLHTADWHLCDRVNRVDRSADLQARVEAVARLLEEHAADALVIAGDLFSEDGREDQVIEAVHHLREAFAAFRARGGTVLAITGNHDDKLSRRINLMQAAMQLVTTPVRPGGRLEPGRWYLFDRPFFATLPDRAGGAVQFVFAPYPSLWKYAEATDEYRTKEEENRLLQGRVADWIQGVARRPDFDPRLPTVLVAHLHVRGSDPHSLYKLTERDDVIFDPGFLPTGWAYVALGHIHKPQALSGLSHVRYSGSLDRLDFGEVHSGHGALLVDVGSAGLVGEPQHLPLPATSFHTIVLSDPETDLPRLANQYLDRETAIVRLTVAHRANGPSRDEVTRELRRLFPRLSELKWVEDTSPANDGSSRFSPRTGFEANVRDYLADKLADDPHKDELLALAETFLTDGGAA